MKITYVYWSKGKQWQNALTIDFGKSTFASMHYIEPLYKDLRKKDLMYIDHISYKRAHGLWKFLRENKYKEVIHGDKLKNITKFLYGEEEYETIF